MVRSRSSSIPSATSPEVANDRNSGVCTSLGSPLTEVAVAGTPAGGEQTEYPVPLPDVPICPPPGLSRLGLSWTCKRPRHRTRADRSEPSCRQTFWDVLMQRLQALTFVVLPSRTRVIG
jgi:hypothetical protein